MNFDRFLQFFVIKEKRFFPLYIQSAQNILKASELLVSTTETEDAEDRRILAHRIKECEVVGDKITDRIIDELLDAFVTPFDRDDIHLIAEDMDTFLDNIRDASKKFAIYQPQKSENLAKIARYIRDDAEIILQLTESFDKMRDKAKEMDDLCDRIKENEHICDDIYESYMSSLFSSEKDPIELVRKKNILQALEDTSDVAKRLAGSIRSVVVKLS